MKIKTNPLSRKEIENIALNVRKYFNIADDELLEVTPNFLRMRKKILKTDLRAKARNGK